MKIFIFILPLLATPCLKAEPICPIMKTIVKATSINNKKILNFCDLDTHFKLTFGDKNNPEIILYKKSHEVYLSIPMRGTELIILDGDKRYVIRDDELKAYIVAMDDTKGTVVFTELDNKNNNYINRSYTLLSREN